ARHQFWFVRFLPARFGGWSRDTEKTGPLPRRRTLEPSVWLGVSGRTAPRRESAGEPAAPRTRFRAIKHPPAMAALHRVRLRESGRLQGLRPCSGGPIRYGF